MHPELTEMVGRLMSVAKSGGLLPRANSSKGRILLAHNHFLIAEMLAMFLALHFEVVGVVTEGEHIVDEFARLWPEVLLLDVAKPELSWLAAARLILERAPGTKVVFLTTRASCAVLREFFRAGTSSFVEKSCSPNDLVQAVKIVLTGTDFVSPGLKESLGLSCVDELSERQITVLRLVAQGYTAKEIGSKLKISPRTAEFHKNSIMEKLKLRTTAELTRYALDAGLTS